MLPSSTPEPTAKTFLASSESSLVNVAVMTREPEPSSLTVRLVVTTAPHPDNTNAVIAHSITTTRRSGELIELLWVIPSGLSFVTSEFMASPPSGEDHSTPGPGDDVDNRSGHWVTILVTGSQDGRTTFSAQIMTLCEEIDVF